MNILILIFIFSCAAIFPAWAEADGTSLQRKLLSCNQSLDTGDYGKAAEFAQQALSEDMSNQEAWLCKGRAHMRAGQIQQAIESIQSAEQKAQTPYEHMMALTLLGNAQKNARQYQEALHSYRQSLVFSKQEKSKRFEHINLNLIGDALLDSGDAQAALGSYQAASLKAANDNERADSFERIAAGYLALKQYDPAIEYQIKAQMMQEKSGTLDQYASASLELGRMLTEAKDYKRAESTLNKIIQFSKDNGGAYYEAKGYCYLAKVKAATGDATKARSLLTNASSIAGQINDPDLIQEVGNTLSQMPN